MWTFSPTPLARERKLSQKKTVPFMSQRKSLFMTSPTWLGAAYRKAGLFFWPGRTLLLLEANYSQHCKACSGLFVEMIHPPYIHYTQEEMVGIFLKPYWQNAPLGWYLSKSLWVQIAVPVTGQSLSTRALLSFKPKNKWLQTWHFKVFLASCIST